MLRLLLLIVYVTVLSMGLQQAIFSIREEEAIGSLVGILLPKLPDELRTAASAGLVFRPLQKGHVEFFSVASPDGRITIARTIDREELCPSDASASSVGLGSRTSSEFALLPLFDGQCQLKFTVSLLPVGAAEIIDVIQVTVNVLDVNDNKCQFEPSDHQTVYISEDTRPGPAHKIGLNRPADPDADSMHRIDPQSIRLRSIDEVDSARFFDLHVADTSSLERPVSLHLSITRQLDFEVNTEHKVIVTASDVSRKADNTCTLHLTVKVVDVNDNAPKFEKKIMHLQLDENAEVGSVVFNLKANDDDKGDVFSQLVYGLGSFASPEVRQNFHVAPMNGSIILKRKLSFAQKSKYEIPVVVRNPTSAEAANTHAGNNRDHEVMISKSTPLETTVHDTARLIVSVIDVNDETPTISAFNLNGETDLSIPENGETLPSDFAVIGVTDGDTGDNGKVDCSLSANSSQLFRLTRISPNRLDHRTDVASELGSQSTETLFKLSAITSFDRESNALVLVQIVCNDFGTPRRTAEKNFIVRIQDGNDNAPKFEKPNLTLRVFEDSAPSRRNQHFEIGKVTAHDPDDGINAELKYSLLQSQDKPVFRIDEKTGVISSNGNLDREKEDMHEFVVIAQDGGSPPHSSSVKITLFVSDYNDETPAFSHPEYEFFVTEGADSQQTVGTLFVTDSDEGKNGELRFRLQASDLMRHYPLSDDSLQYHWRADQGNLPYRLVPQFIRPENRYEVRIVADGAIDREATILDTNQLSDIQMATPGNLQGDFVFPKPEEPPVSHSFYVIAEDSGSPKRVSRARVTVNIQDVNDNAPFFAFPSINNSTVNVSYKEHVGFEFARVIATDADAGLNGTVQYYLTMAKSFLQDPGDSTTAMISDSRLGSSQSDSKSFKERESFIVDHRRGYISLKRSLSEADVGQTFRLLITAKDMAAWRPRQTDAILMVIVDKSKPRGTPQTKNSWGFVASGFLGKNISDSMINFFIIIFIVAAAFIISAVLLTAVCLVLRKSRRHSANPRIIPKMNHKPIQCLPQNPDAYCGMMNGIPVSFQNSPGGFTIGKMHPTMTLVTDYLPVEHHRWPVEAATPGLIRSSPDSNVLYATLASGALVQCAPCDNQYMNSANTVDRKHPSFSFLPAATESILPETTLEQCELQNVGIQDEGVCSGVTSSAVDSAAFPGTPFIQYSFARDPNSDGNVTTSNNLDSFAWIGSQELYQDRSELNEKRESATSNDQDSGHGDSLDTAGLQTNGSTLCKSPNSKFFNNCIPSSRCFSTFSPLSGLGPIYDDQISARQQSITGSNTTCVLHHHYPGTTSIKWNKPGGPPDTVEAPPPMGTKKRVGSRERIVDASPEIVPLIPSSHENCSTFI